IAEALRTALPQTTVEVAEWDGPDDPLAQDDPGQPGSGQAALADSDAVIVVVGRTSHRSYDDELAEHGAIAGRAGSATGGEGGARLARADVSLPGEQDALVRAVREATPGPVPVIAVVVAGRPHVLTDVVSHSEATIWAGYPGPFGGEAIAELVLGAAEPTGRLPMTLPSHPAALPLRYNDRQSPTGVYQDVPEPVLFPFGHGLRYRHWDVSAVDTVVDADQVRILVTLVSHSDAPTHGTVAAFGHRR